MSTSDAYDEALATRPFKHDIDRRDRRALSEGLVVLDYAPDIYQVYSEAGTEYLVDTRLPSCTCPDFMYRDADCKHIRRVRLETDGHDVERLETEIQTAIDKLDAHLDNLATQRDELADLMNSLDRLRRNQRG